MGVTPGGSVGAGDREPVGDGDGDAVGDGEGDGLGHGCEPMTFQEYRPYVWRPAFASAAHLSV